MRPAPLRYAFAIALGFLAIATAAGQQPGYPTPLLKSVLPAGGRVGTTVEVTVDGADLDGVTALYFSDAGLKAERLPDPPVDPKKKNPPPPPLKFKVAVGDKVPLGSHDVRVVGKWGISNPRAFVVGELPEALEAEPNDDVDKAQRIEIGSTTTGVIASRTDVDYVAFAGKRGQRVAIHCAATTIDSRLTAYLQLFSPSGRELGSNRFYRDGDALIGTALPEDGDYLVRICEFAYQNGGPESFYRLTVSAGPWLDAAYPPVVQRGQATPVLLLGRNLPGGAPAVGFPGREQLGVSIAPPAQPEAFPGRLLPRMGTVNGFGYRMPGSNPLWIGYAEGKVVLDNGTNDTAETAQEVTVPVEICGRFEKRADRDCYAFTAKKGEVVVIEGFADRLRSPTDLYCQLRRTENGQIVGEYDANPDLPPNADRLFTYSDDPLGRATIPADGRYELIVSGRDSAARPSIRDVYCVALRRPQPDFQLVMVANHDTGSGLTLHRGSSQAVQVVCFRRDGFDSEIALTAEGLPAGVTCAPQVLGPKLQQSVLVLSAASNAKDWAGDFRITGTAVVDKAKIVREARPGTLVFPGPNNNANTPTVSRLTRTACLAVRDPGPFAVTADAKPLAIPVGGSGSVKVKVSRQQPTYKDNVAITTATAPPQSNGKTLSIPNINVAPDKDGEVKISVPTNAPPGTYSLVFRGTGKLTLDDPTTKKKRNSQFVAVSPPIAVTVFDAAAELSFPQPVEVRAGSTAMLAVKVKRLHGYDGPLSVELVPPKSGNPGVSAAAVTIPAKATDGTLTLKADAKAKPTPDATFTVRATAKIGNSTLRTETELHVAVADASGKPPMNVKAVELLPKSAADWRYAADVKGSDWLKPDFDDKGWKVVKAPFGNGEAEIASRKGTEVPDVGEPLFARRAFDVPADLLKQKDATFRLRVASDNSAAVYLNGKPADEDSGDHEFSYWNREVTIPAALLKPGRNIVAVRLDNAAGSSDAYLDLELVAEVPAPKK